MALPAALPHQGSVDDDSRFGSSCNSTDTASKLIAGATAGFPTLDAMQCPACGEDDRRNREGELFRGVACDHTGDADFIGARNVSIKTLAALGHV